MQMTHHKPAARGVNQLMYVGDIEIDPIPWVKWGAIALAAWWLLR